MIKLNFGSDFSIEIGSADISKNLDGFTKNVLSNIMEGKNPFDFKDKDGRINIKLFG